MAERYLLGEDGRGGGGCEILEIQYRPEHLNSSSTMHNTAHNKGYALWLLQLRLRIQMTVVSLNELANKACDGLVGAFYLIGSALFKCKEYQSGKISV